MPREGVQLILESSICRPVESSGKERSPAARQRGGWEEREREKPADEDPEAGRSKWAFAFGANEQLAHLGRCDGAHTRRREKEGKLAREGLNYIETGRVEKNRVPSFWILEWKDTSNQSPDKRDPFRSDIAWEVRSMYVCMNACMYVHTVGTGTRTHDSLITVGPRGFMLNAFGLLFPLQPKRVLSVWLLVWPPPPKRGLCVRRRRPKPVLGLPLVIGLPINGR